MEHESRDREFREEKKYPIKCSGCGKDSTVKFPPTPGREVFCFECYKKRRERRE